MEGWLVPEKMKRHNPISLQLHGVNIKDGIDTMHHRVPIHSPLKFQNHASVHDEGKLVDLPLVVAFLWKTKLTMTSMTGGKVSHFEDKKLNPES